MQRCSLKGCPFNTSGKCIENQLPNCPNLVEDGASIESAGPLDSLPEIQPAPIKPAMVPIYSGKKLSAEEAASIFQLNPFVVVLAGMVESGKTTLIARLFEMFQSNEVDGYRFMATRTPQDFALISWHATMESGGSDATTEHTYRAESNFFFHLRVRPTKKASGPIDFLFSDIPGEMFPEAVSNESVCRGLQALRRADHVVLCFDVGIISNQSARHDHTGKLFSFVKMAMQTGQVGQHTVIHFVISKADKLPNQASDEIFQYLESIQKDFRKRFGHKVGGLHFRKVAARPENETKPTIDVINEIFSSWMARATPHAKSELGEPVRSRFSRDFCRFGLN